MTEPKKVPGPRLGWPLGPIAHRGLHDPARRRIENTAEAFEAAIAKGYAIECDLQAAAGYEPVVFHDETLDRLIEANGPVASRSVADLKRLPFRQSPDHILTLDELFELVAGRVPLFVEIKTMFDAQGSFEWTISHSLKAYRGPLAVMSFDHRSMAMMRILAPEIPRGMISYRWDDAWMPQLAAAEKAKLRALSYHREVTPSFIHYDIDDLPEAAPLELKRELGIPLLTWTVRTPEQRTRAKLYADEIVFEGFEA